MDLAINRGITVLYVDNDPECWQEVSYGLLDEAEVKTFVKAEQALARLKDTVCHVVIVRLGMPGVDALEFARNAHELNPCIAIVAIHDLPDDDEQVIRARESRACFTVCRADDFFESETMIKIVREASKEYARRSLARLREQHRDELQKRLRKEGAADVHLPAPMRTQALIVAHLTPYLDIPVSRQLLLLMAADYYDIGRLTTDDPERAQQASVRILDGLAGFEEILEAALNWREHWNGAGPQGKRGEEIPLFARIIAVVDEFVRLTAGDGGREEVVSVSAALQGIEAQSGRRFDPEVVPVFVSMVEEKRSSQKPADSSHLFLEPA